MYAVVVAAGRGERFGRAKALLRLGGKTLTEHVLAALRAAGPWDGIALVARPEDAATFAKMRLAGVVVVAGGERRQDSVLAGLEGLGLREGRVLVHDVARPLVTPEVIRRVKEAPGVAVSAAVAEDDSLRRLVKGGSRPLSREGVMRVQTPQAFDVRALLERLRGAHRVATDEASLFPATEVRLVAGDARNIKITRPADLMVAERLFGSPEIWIGHGYDIHRTVLGGPMRLGGVTIPSDVGLVGHSDADVVLHAVADALLGAAGEGDIGTFFPPDEPRWAGLDSAEIVALALDRLAARGLAPRQLDVTVVATTPRLAPHREAIRSRLATLLALDPTSVNLKATTDEGLGEVGRGLGVKAWAVALLGTASQAEPRPSA